MSAISLSRKDSISAMTSATVRPEASIRARMAALISAVAAGMSAGIVSQCGSPVTAETVPGAAGVAVVVILVLLVSSNQP